MGEWEEGSNGEEEEEVVDMEEVCVLIIPVQIKLKFWGHFVYTTYVCILYPTFFAGMFAPWVLSHEIRVSFLQQVTCYTCLDLSIILSTRWCDFCICLSVCRYSDLCLSVCLSL